MMHNPPSHDILIVQEETQLGALWARHLTRLGARVDLIETGDQAIRSLERGRYDAVVLDLMHSDGLAFPVADMVAYRQPDAAVIFVTRSSFFSDGSVFGHSPNARAILRASTEPADLAAIVWHYGTGKTAVTSAHEAGRNPATD